MAILGIVDKILVEEGDLVIKGDLIAKIRVVPNEQEMQEKTTLSESPIFVIALKSFKRLLKCSTNATTWVILQIFFF